MLSLFGFGKRRRKTTRKTSRKAHHKKPPARLLKICKKYRVKTTRKVGGKRVYKPVKVLAKACLKKALAAKKSHGRKTRKTVHRKRRVHRRVRSSMFGEDMMTKKSCFGNHDMMKKPVFGTMPFVKQSPSFGKRRAVGRKVSRAGAMKAFRSFYKRHCAGMRRSRFGNGGNPPLGMNMGYEFCPSGMGGVLGATSTGLFPSPCTSMNMGQAQAEANLSLPAYSSSGIGGAASSSQLASYANMFGRRVRRRKVRASSLGSTKKRVSALGARRRKKRANGMGAADSRRRTSMGSTRKRASGVGSSRRKRRVRCAY